MRRAKRSSAFDRVVLLARRSRRLNGSADSAGWPGVFQARCGRRKKPVLWLEWDSAPSPQSGGVALFDPFGAAGDATAMNTRCRWLTSIAFIATSYGVFAATPLSEDERFVRMVHATGRIYMVVLNQVEFRGVEGERPTSLVRVGSARRLGMMRHSDSIPVLVRPTALT